MPLPLSFNESKHRIRSIGGGYFSCMDMDVILMVEATSADMMKEESITEDQRSSSL